MNNRVWLWFGAVLHLDLIKNFFTLRSGSILLIFFTYYYNLFKYICTRET